MPCHVSVFFALLLDALVTVKLILLVVSVVENTVLLATPLILREIVALPPDSVIVTVELVLNSKPAGALIIIVPIPISPVVPSAILGLVKVVHVPAALHPAVVLDAIVVPPVAVVTVTVACAE